MAGTASDSKPKRIPRPAPARKRLRRWLLLAILVVAMGGLVLAWGPVFTAYLLAENLATFFGRPCTIGAVSWRLAPFSVEVYDLRVAGPVVGAPPFLHAPKVSILPSLESLLSTQILISRLRVDGLIVRVNAYPRGGDDIPRVGQSGGSRAGLRIRRLTIQGGEFILNHHRVPLELDLPDFHGRLGPRRRGVLAGEVGFGQGRIRFGDGPSLPIATEVFAVLEGARLTIESGRLITARSNLTYQGAISIAGDPKGEFKLKGPVDLDELDRHIWRTGFGIQGDATYDGVVTIDGPKLRFQGNLEGAAGVFDAVPVRRFKGFFGWDEHGVVLRALQVETLGGSAQIDLTVPPSSGDARLGAVFSEIDVEGATRALFDLGPFNVGGAGTGELSLSWPAKRFRALSGEIQFDIARRDDKRTPLWGRFEWTARAGLQQIERADLHTPSTNARIKGTVDEARRIQLEVDGDSIDLAAADDLSARLRSAFGNPEAVPALLFGRGSFSGRARGTLVAPVFEGRFSAQDFGFLNVNWGRADWRGALTSDAVLCHSLVLKRGGAEIWFDGEVENGIYGEHDALTARARMRDWPVADLVEAFGWDVKASGRVSGEAAVEGRRSAPRGWTRLTAHDGRYLGLPYDTAEVDALLRGREVYLRQARLHLGRGTLSLHGSVTDDEIYDLAAEASDLSAAQLLPAPSPRVSWAGDISGRASFVGTLTRPRLRAEFSAPDMALGEASLGSVTAELQGDGSGLVDLRASCRSPRLDLTRTGNVSPKPPFAAQLELVAREARIDPLLRLLTPRLPAEVAIALAGRLATQGPLAQPEAMTLRGLLSDARILFPELPIRNRGPVSFAVEDGRLKLESCELTGEGTDLKLSGSAQLLGTAPRDLALALEGSGSLATLSAFFPKLRGRGQARVAATLKGTSQAPEVTGQLIMQDGGLRVRGFPHGLEALKGVIDFTQNGAQTRSLTLRLGGSEIAVDGEAVYGREGLSSFDIQARGERVALRYPEGLRSVLDLNLRLLGDGTQQWITGVIDVRQALWTKRYDVASELLTPAQVEMQGSGVTGDVRYNVRINAPGTLRIDNNLTTLDARADLLLQGTLAAPVVLGRADIERGRIFFRGNTYVIRRGTIDFANPSRIDPLFDIEADTNVRSYRVALRVTGSLERVHPTLTSDPPLSALQILNLLAGADESAVSNYLQVQRDQAYLAATGAATLAAGRLSEEVGLERGAQRLFGLSRFSIDPRAINPALAEGDITTTARLTVGKRLTRDLNVLWAQDLGGKEDRLLSLEYLLSDRLSLLLTRAQRPGEDGEYGFDILLRHSK